LVREGRAEAVKLEGGLAVVDQILAITNAGIPVVGHVGLTPQSVHAMGGFKVQGRNESGADQVLRDAHAVVEAGACMVVLEGIPKELAERVTETLPVPTIGIGAGVGCDGQVLVCTDLLGMNPQFRPKFVRNFIDGYALMRGAFEQYVKAVQARSFPSDAESFSSPGLGERKAVGDKVTRLY
jgi:3-methyl-2-oxobutanoate hydroxymethyltransferase